MSEAPEVQSFKPGTTLFKQGDQATVAYFITKGSVEISVMAEGRNHALNTVGANAIVGEMAVIDPAPRMATATAVEPTECRTITPAAFAKLLATSPPLSVHLLRSLIRTARLRVGIPVALKEDDKVATAGRNPHEFTDRRIFAAGATIFKGGQTADGLYLVQSGEVEIRHGTAGPVLRTFLPGEVFGERGLFEKAERFADAYAKGATTCEFVSVDRFNAAMKDTPQILVGLMRIYVKAY